MLCYGHIGVTAFAACCGSWACQVSLRSCNHSAEGGVLRGLGGSMGQECGESVRKAAMYAILRLPTVTWMHMCGASEPALHHAED